MSRTTTPVTPARPGIAGIAAIGVATVLQLGVGFLSLTSGLVAPLWAIAVLGLVWLFAAAVLIRLARTRPLVTLAVPLANAAVWVAFIWFGGTVLGWSA